MNTHRVSRRGEDRIPVILASLVRKRAAGSGFAAPLSVSEINRVIREQISPVVDRHPEAAANSFFESYVPKALLKHFGDDGGDSKGIDENCVVPLLFGQFSLVQLCIRAALDAAIFRYRRLHVK